MEKHIHWITPVPGLSSAAAPKWASEWSAGATSAAPPRRVSRAAATDGHRHPQQRQVALIRQTLGDRAEGPPGGG